MNKYEFTLKHDTGKIKITVCAVSIVKAIEVICSNEGCPKSAILSIIMPDKNTLEYNLMYNIGHAKYVVNVHTNEFYSNGSKFFNIAIFSNKKKRDAYIKELENKIKENK